MMELKCCLRTMDRPVSFHANMKFNKAPQTIQVPLTQCKTRHVWVRVTQRRWDSYISYCNSIELSKHQQNKILC